MRTMAVAVPGPGPWRWPRLFVGCCSRLGRTLRPRWPLLTQTTTPSLCLVASSLSHPPTPPPPLPLQPPQEARQVPMSSVHGRPLLLYRAVDASAAPLDVVEDECLGG